MENLEKCEGENCKAQTLRAMTNAGLPETLTAMLK